MTDWWSNDPIASAPTAPAPAQPVGNWWDADPTLMPAPPKPAEDPLRAQVRKDLDKAYEAGLPKPGFARQFVQGATLNTADEILAAPSALVRALLKGTSLGDAYQYEKTRENMMLEDAAKDSPISGAAGQVLGGVLTGGGLMKAGATAIPAAVSRLGTVAGTAAGGAVDGAALGAVSGFADGDSLQSRLEETARGASIGGAVGGALPLGAAAIKPLAAPIVSNVAARINPMGYAERQVGRAAARSGQTGDQIADRLGLAASEGQGEYRLLDALGNPGARLGSTVARNPGEGRTQIRQFLDDRQIGQGRRIGEAVTEAFDTPQTARSQTKDLYDWARDASDPFYEKALAQTPVWSERLNDFLKDPITKGGIKRGMEIQRLEALAKGEKFDPFDVIDHFDAAGEPVMLKVPNMRTVNVVKKGFDDILEQYRDGVTGKLNLDEKGRAIDQVRRSFLDEVDKINPDFAKARGVYAGPMQIKDALALGRQAGAGRSRAADNIAQFEGMNDAAKQGFRVGYVDPVLGRVERAAEGVNKARQFSSDSAKAEIGAFAREGQAEKLTRRLGRENEMFANRAQATGGSATADNLADNADAGVDAGMFAKLLTGQFGGALKDALTRGAAGINGNTEAVRQNLAKLLMNGSPDEVRALLTKLARGSSARGELGGGLYRGLLSGGVPAINSLIGERGRRPNLPAARTTR